jgi:photosystem II stability/assembly factor-like uncharacterized protein
MMLVLLLKRMAMRPNPSYILLILSSLLVYSHAHWTRLGDPGGGFVFSLAQKDSFLFAGTVSGVFRSIDRGEQWALADSGLPGNLGVYSILARESGIFIATDISKNGVFRSTENGAYWKAADSGLPETPGYCFAQNGIDLFLGTYDYVFRSTDNGIRWKQLSTDMLREHVQAMAFMGTILFAGTGFGGIARSADLGASWTSIDSGLPSLYVTALAVQDTRIFAGTAEGVCFSSDSGAYWTTADSGIPEGTFVNTLIAAGDLVFAGTTSGIYVSTNNGLRWSSFNSGLPENTEAQSFLVCGTDILCGTNNSGVWKAPLSDVAAKKGRRLQGAGSYPVPRLSIQLRPAPVIEFSLASQEEVSVSIVNLAGKKITILTNRLFPAGKHRITMDAGISPGCYTILMRTQKTTLVKRIAVLK